MDALMGHFVYICIFMHLVDDNRTSQSRVKSVENDPKRIWRNRRSLRKIEYRRDPPTGRHETGGPEEQAASRPKGQESNWP
jgi:hypothetical protein